jgi:hypothetical protein
MYTNAVNITTHLNNISCKQGDVVIFNANLIHTGMLHLQENHLRIQMKFTHIDDISKIGYYEDYHKVLDKESKSPLLLRKFHQSISCRFPIISDLMQSEIVRTIRGSDNGEDVGIAQRVYSYMVYGDSNYMDIPNSY